MTDVSIARLDHRHKPRAPATSAVVRRWRSRLVETNIINLLSWRHEKRSGGAPSHRHCAAETDALQRFDGPGKLEFLGELYGIHGATRRSGKDIAILRTSAGNKRMRRKPCEGPLSPR